MLAKLPDDEDAGLNPGVRRLVGLLPRTVSVEEHRRHLRGKYRP